MEMHYLPTAAAKRTTTARRVAATRRRQLTTPIAAVGRRRGAKYGAVERGELQLASENAECTTA
jgi:hypothetical protein